MNEQRVGLADVNLEVPGRIPAAAVTRGYSLVALLALLFIAERTANHTEAGRLLRIAEAQRQKLQLGGATSTGALARQRVTTYYRDVLLNTTSLPTTFSFRRGAQGNPWEGNWNKHSHTVTFCAFLQHRRQSPSSSCATKIPASSYPLRLELANEWMDYSLGDIVKIPPAHAAAKNEVHKVCRQHPGSIGCQYLKSPSHRANNWELLNQLITEHGQSVHAVPGPATTVVHIRLGDTVDPLFAFHLRQGKAVHGWRTAGSCFDTQCVTKTPTGQHRIYVYHKEYYASLLCSGRIRPPNETDIAVVGFAYHHHRDWSRTFVASHDYRNQLVQWFREKGYTVRNMGDHEPDADFVYMSHASTVVLGGGGYANLVERMLRLRGGVGVRCPELDASTGTCQWDQR